LPRDFISPDEFEISFRLPMGAEKITPVSKQDPKRLSSTHALPHVGAKRHCRVNDHSQYITIDD
jgi:hypothetical protein